MERKLQERMVGAAVLILALVVLGPMVLDGSSESTVEVDVPGQRGDELHTHTFQLDRSPPARPSAADAGPVTEAPTPRSAAPGMAPGTGPAAAGSPEPAEKASKPAQPRALPADATPPTVKPSGANAVAVAPAPAPPPPGAATVAPPAGGAWLVQVGTFGQKDNAERLVKKLKGSGFAAVVSPTTGGGKTLYRVRVGPAGSRDAASDLARRLAAAGQAGQVVPK